METRKVTVRPLILTSGRNTDKNGECIIYINVIKFGFGNLENKQKRISTNLKVNPKNWNKDKGLVTSGDSDYKRKNEIIEAKLAIVNKEISMIKENPNEVKLVSEFLNVEKKTLTNYFDDYIKYRQSINTPRGTLKEFTTCKNRLSRYENAKGVKLNFEDMNLSFSDKFQAFLLAEGFKAGTIGKTYTILKTVLFYFYERQKELKVNVPDNFKYKSFKRGESSVNDPNPLNPEQLKLLINHTFKFEGQNRIKDRFLFQCSMGARYSDAFSIGKGNIKDECILYYPAKTVHKKDNLVIVPLNPLSKSILEKYNYDMTALRISNQKYNEGLEGIFNILAKEYPAYFNGSFTSHNGRDTFITNCINGGVDVPMLLKMVGQNSWAIMQRYFKPSQAVAKEKMKAIEVFQL